MKHDQASGVSTGKLSVALLLVLICSLEVMADAPPLTFAEIGKLRLARNTHGQIVDLAKDRGIGFTLDAKGKARLRVMRFKPDQIALMEKIADGRWAAEKKKADVAKADWEATKPGAMKPGTAPAGVSIGPRMPEGWHKFILRQTKRIQDEAKTSTAIYPQRTVTVVCSKKAATVHLANVKKLEAILAKQFPEPIATGTDKRSATIVLLDDRYEYEKWVKAMFAIYKADGMTINGQDPLGMALKGPAFLTSTMTVADLSRMPEQTRPHQAVFSVGYLYMNHLSERQAPDGLVNGFGNLMEELVLGKPAIRVNAYAAREIGGTNSSWAAVVAGLLKKKELPTIGRVLNYTMQDMKSEEYCVAWSMVSMMSKDPASFTRWLVAIRDKKEPKASIEPSYQKTVDQLAAIWERAIRGK